MCGKKWIGPDAMEMECDDCKKENKDIIESIKKILLIKSKQDKR